LKEWELLKKDKNMLTWLWVYSLNILQNKLPAKKLNVREETVNKLLVNMIQVADNVGQTSLHVLSVENPLWQETITDVKDANIKCMKVKFKRRVFISVHFVIRQLILENLVLRMNKTDYKIRDRFLKLKMIIFYRYYFHIELLV